ncbi:MAG: hypothetical protein M3083_22155 [Actinomycetota bacterium]|nr:hypothetical protein [Actinomycetota bacterium]
MPDRQDYCSGCGQRPEELQPTEAVALLRLLQRRSTTLARRGRTKPSRAAPNVHRAQSTAAAAGRVLAVLASTDRRLRRLFAEPEPWTTVGDAPCESPGIARLAASAADTAERLVVTIASASAEDWFRRRSDQDVSAAELTWLALHEATHYLEDVELALAHKPTLTVRDLNADESPMPVGVRRLPSPTAVPLSVVSLCGPVQPSTAASRRWSPGVIGWDDAS